MRIKYILIILLLLLPIGIGDTGEVTVTLGKQENVNANTNISEYWLTEQGVLDDVSDILQYKYWYNYTALYPAVWIDNGSVIHQVNEYPVGIGTSNPNATLHINSSATPAMIIERWNVNNAVIEFRNNNNNTFLGMGGNDRFYISLNRDVALDPIATFTREGRLGIGTNDPAGEIDVRDAETPAIYVTDTTNNITGFTSGCAWFSSASNTKTQIGSRYNHTMQIFINNSEVMTFLVGGFVGINNSAPAVTLDVNGNVSADDFYTKSLAFSGDALSKIDNIKPENQLSNSFSKVDHNSLGDMATSFYYNETLYDEEDNIIGYEQHLFEGQSVDRTLAVLIKANQELLQRVEDLEWEVARLKK